MADYDSSDEYENEDPDQEYHSEDEEEEDSMGSLDDSDLEYSESESTTDSYVYPWPTSSDDSWADISSDEVIQKILLKLPQYDPPDPNADKEEKAYGSREDLIAYLSEHSDSFIERTDELLEDLKERAAKYHNSKGITETEYNQYMKDVDMEQLDDMDEEFLRDRYPMAMESQLTQFSDKQSEFVPDLYLAKVELYEMYLDNESDADNECSDADVDTEKPIEPEAVTQSDDAVQIEQSEKIEPAEPVKTETNETPESPKSTAQKTPPKQTETDDDDRKESKFCVYACYMRFCDIIKLKTEARMWLLERLRQLKRNH